MGWINEFEQQKILSLYGRVANFRCNNCTRLIWLDELEVIDPKGGYFRVKRSEVNSYQNMRAHPKVTYCRQCDDVLSGKKPKDVYGVDEEATNVDSVAEKILAQLQKYPKGEWRTRKLVKMWPGKVESSIVRAAVKQLKKEKKVVKRGKFLFTTQTKEQGNDNSRKGTKTRKADSQTRKRKH